MPFIEFYYRNPKDYYSLRLMKIHLPSPDFSAIQNYCFKCSIALLLILSSSCSNQKISEQSNPGTTTSPYALAVEQPDGTQIDVIGKGNMYSPYTETLDGYTILKNKEGIYEYANIGSKRELELSGIKANNTEDRSKSEIKFLQTIDKHLRHPNN